MLTLSNLRAITLDLDDTLWPIWPTIARAEQALVLWLQGQAPATAALFANPATRLSLREQVALARPDLGHNLSALRMAVIRQGLLQSGEDVSLAPTAFEVFFEARMQVELFDDALPALARLARHFPVVALSNGNADVNRVGIGAHFVASVSAHEFGVGKPDARIFHAAARAAGVSAEQVLHVGDDALLDVVGALGAGMQTAWLNRDDHAWPDPPPAPGMPPLQPHVTVRDLTELCELLGLPAG